MRAPGCVEPEELSSTANQDDPAEPNRSVTSFVHSHENTPQQKSSAVLPLRSKGKKRGATSNRSGLSEHGNTTQEHGSLSVKKYCAVAICSQGICVKVFSTLFYTRTPYGQPGDVNWTDFLHAMHAIGFLPIELHGSAWSFSPGRDIDNVWQQTINFHEPHPSSKLAFVVARRYGRQLTRNFGLTGDSFVLED